MGSGDLDGDGFSNAAEYANVTQAGGGLEVFVRAALDPKRDGTESLGSPGLCVIATAAYGTPLATEIRVLREIRDEYLLTNPFGIAFTDGYYRLSPPIADIVAHDEFFRGFVRIFLSYVILASTHWALSWTLVVLGFAVCLSARRRRRTLCQN